MTHHRPATSLATGLLIVLISTILSACGSSAPTKLPPGDTLTVNSSLLTIVDHGGGLVSASVRDPWSTTAPPRLYLLVNRGTPADSIPDIDGAIIIDVPVRSALVYSSVHASAFDELGVADIVTGVADGSYFAFGPFPEAIRSGHIVDVGNSMSPSLEAIVDLSPDVALISPYQNAGHGVLDKTGIPVVEMADYMETTPLGRAEWLLLVGALTGRLDKARQIYDRVVNDYNAIRSDIARTSAHPLVITELPASGTWFQPGGTSYAATLVRDAGGRPVTDGDSSTGSLQLDEAAAFDLGGDADVWLIKSDHDITMAEIASSGSLTSRIRAFNNHNIWIADTRRVPFFDHVTFHPERIVREYANIFAGNSDSTKYFHKLGL